MKRANALDVVGNPFVKLHNKSWTVKPPASLTARVSPPRSRRSTKKVDHHECAKPDSLEGVANEPGLEAGAAADTVYDGGPTTAAVEAGDVGLDDPVAFFSSKLLQSARPEVAGVPRISHSDWLDLYQSNRNPHGRHFVIHQHDHPMAGMHYDLRLQCNESSSISWACMYGLPGDPNSRRLNRNVTETRVHNLWVGILSGNKLCYLRLTSYISTRIILSRRHHF